MHEGPWMAPSICGDRDEMPTAGGCQGPVEDSPCHLTADAPALCQSVVRPRFLIAPVDDFSEVSVFHDEFFLEDPKLRSDLCGSWMKTSPSSAFMHLHVALHLGAREGTDCCSGAFGACWRGKIRGNTFTRAFMMLYSSWIVRKKW